MKLNLNLSKQNELNLKKTHQGNVAFTSQVRILPETFELIQKRGGNSATNVFKQFIDLLKKDGKTFFVNICEKKLHDNFKAPSNELEMVLVRNKQKYAFKIGKPEEVKLEDLNKYFRGLTRT